jgi:nucleoside-diphosphate-sugar epimerase
VVRGDIRTFSPGLLDGVEAVCDLAALSNDPAGELDPRKTMEINHEGRHRVARLAKQAGVKRYVLASSCSVYGYQDGLLDETSSVRPLTTYAEANIAAEQSILPMADERFCVTALRQATVYGLSPRMRFDLAVNGMTLGMHKNGRIPLLRDGTQWRPMVHVQDTAKAFAMVLRADPALINGQIINVGSDEQNFQILPLAQQIAAALGRDFAFDWYGDPDKRSYRVSFQKIKSLLDFRPQYTPAYAAREIARALDEARVVPDARTRTVEWYKNLLHWNAVLKEILLEGVVL